MNWKGVCKGSSPVLSNRIFCKGGNIVYLLCPVQWPLTPGHYWVLTRCKHLKCDQGIEFLFNLNLNNNVWLLYHTEQVNMGTAYSRFDVWNFIEHLHMPGNVSDSGHVLVNKRNTDLLLMKQNLTLFLQQKLPDSSLEPSKSPGALNCWGLLLGRDGKQNLLWTERIAFPMHHGV